MICSDTDSIVGAYEDKNIDNLVRPDLLTVYNDGEKVAFLPTDLFSKRTPGLFKNKMSATHIIALCSKTKTTENEDDVSKKVSSKGLSVDGSFRVSDYGNVLETRETGRGVNYHFRIKRDQLYQCRQERAGLPYLYVKREVSNDGFSSRALYLWSERYCTFEHLNLRTIEPVYSWATKFVYSVNILMLYVYIPHLTHFVDVIEK